MMTAEAGPGPSTMASTSPPVPAVARRMKQKKRAINLVNPAEPVEFLNDEDDSGGSLQEAWDNRRGSRESTPLDVAPLPMPDFTPLSVNEYGVKGILRSAGTPGSGNGVRFFPKNRFRVITPNSTLGPATPQKAATPAPAPAQSFFSQLLSVVPTMSPRRAAPPPLSPEQPEEPNESWEQPGEEGEISLIGSSVHSGDRSRLAAQGEEEEEEEGTSAVLEVPWVGTPEVHSSPLTLPVGEMSSRDISIHDLPAPDMPRKGTNSSGGRRRQRDASQGSIDWANMGQHDVSDLLATTLPSLGEGSISISSVAGPSFLPPSPYPSAPPPPSSQSQTIEQDFAVEGASWMNKDQSSLVSVPEEDDNPTIRRRLSPVPSPPPQHVSSRSTPLASDPTRTVESSPLAEQSPKTFTSIFADMSAEQAGLVWPLPRTADAASSDSTFHSITSALSPLRPLAPGLVAAAATAPAVPPAAVTPSASTPNETIFYDTTASLFTPTPAGAAKPAHPVLAALSLRPPVVGSLDRHTARNLSTLIAPTQAIFAAHDAHASAISAELEQYRSLAQKLGAEVQERDRVLGEMNLRLVETEMRLAQLSASPRPASGKGRGDTSGNHSGNLSIPSLPSNSPSPSPLSARAASKAAQARTEQEAEVRDLEIRLEKAHTDLRECYDLLERRNKAEAEARKEVEDTRSQMEVLSRQVKEAAVEQRRGVEVQESVARLEEQVKRAEDGKRAADERAEFLDQEVGRWRSVAEQEARGAEKLVKDAQRQVEGLKRENEAVKRELESERDTNRDLEVMIDELKSAYNQSLKQSTSQASSAHKLQAEIDRLRAESASKDLEILNLQRRKAELKEDREMLNVALDSKQQEVELLKRKMSRQNNATPLGVSHKSNLDATPHPHGHGLAATTGGATVKRAVAGSHASQAYATPLQANGKTMRNGAQLYASTQVKDRVMRSSAILPPANSVVGVRDTRAGSRGVGGGRRASAESLGRDENSDPARTPMVGGQEERERGQRASLRLRNPRESILV